MKQRFGIDLAHVPYRNSPQSIADVAAGHVAMAFAEAGASLPLIRDGKLRALAVTSSTRLPTVPELPPFGEAVGAPDFEAVSWHVLLAPAGTPPDVVDKLHAEMKRIMEAPDMRKKIADIGLIPLDIASVEQTAPTSGPKAKSGAAWSASSGWKRRNEPVDRTGPKSPPFRPIGNASERHGQTATGRKQTPRAAALSRHAGHRGRRRFAGALRDALGGGRCRARCCFGSSPRASAT